MSGLLTGLETAKRTLLAYQMRLSVLSHNIANAATPGYSRQRALLETTTPHRQMQRSLGTGVRVAQIRRHHDPFFDARARRQMGLLGRFEAQRLSLLEVDSAIGEPGDTGLSAQLSAFWNAWHDLSNLPREASARVAVQGAGKSLADAFRLVHGRLGQIESGINDKLALQIGEVNRLAAELAELHRSVRFGVVTGHEANDFRDRRDRVAGELARLTGAAASIDSRGAMNVRLGGRLLIDGELVNRLALDQALPQGAPEPMWVDSTRPIEGLGGGLGGLLAARQELNAVHGELDRLALAIIDAVNALHDDGSAALNFFTGTGAADIQMATPILSDANLIRTGTDQAGDNSIALGIAGLDSATLVALADVSAGHYLSSLVGKVSEGARIAVDFAESQTELLQQVESQRQATSGVSLDEEAAELLIAQRAFQAAAKVVDTLDSMLETVIVTMAS